MSKAEIRNNVRTVSKEEMIRRDSCYVLDDLRQDHQRDSDTAERAHYKNIEQNMERAREERVTGVQRRRR